MTAPTTQAEQEDAVREEIGFAFGRYLSAKDMDAVTYGRVRAAVEPIAEEVITLRTERDQLTAKLEEAEEEVDIVREDSGQQMRMLDRIAKRLGLAHDEGLEDAEPFLAAIDQLAADLRKAREALTIFAALKEAEWMGEDYVGPSERPGWRHRPTKLALIAIAALTPNPKDAGGTAKGEDHGA